MRLRSVVDVEYDDFDLPGRRAAPRWGGDVFPRQFGQVAPDIGAADIHKGAELGQADDVAVRTSPALISGEQPVFLGFARFFWRRRAPTGSGGCGRDRPR